MSLSIIFTGMTFPGILSHNKWPVRLFLCPFIIQLLLGWALYSEHSTRGLTSTSLPVQNNINLRFLYLLYNHKHSSMHQQRHKQLCKVNIDYQNRHWITILIWLAIFEISYLAVACLNWITFMSKSTKYPILSLWMDLRGRVLSGGGLLCSCCRMEQMVHCVDSYKSCANII